MAATSPAPVHGDQEHHQEEVQTADCSATIDSSVVLDDEGGVRARRDIAKGTALIREECTSTVSDHRPEDVLHKSGLYPIIARVKHSCVPNTIVSSKRRNSDKQKEVVTIVASKDIAAGEYLSRDFLVDGWMDDTASRQTRILQQFGFRCGCQRCEDPTELGCYVGSPCCPDCRENGECNYVVASKDASVWTCEGCGKRTLQGDLTLTNEATIEASEIVRKGGGYEKHPIGPLHPTHSTSLKSKDHDWRCINQRNKGTGWLTRRVQKAWLEASRHLLGAMDRLGVGMHERRFQILLKLRVLLEAEINDSYREMQQCGYPFMLAKFTTANPDLAPAPVGRAMLKAREATEELARADRELALWRKFF